MFTSIWMQVSDKVRMMEWKGNWNHLQFARHNKVCEWHDKNNVIVPKWRVKRKKQSS